jgi:NADPH2:quinone reductase
VEVPFGSLVPLPDEVCDETAAAVLLKGLMAYTLLLQLRPIMAGEWVLLQAAAGGVGLLVCQMARHLGIRVIGTASSAEKRDLARANGCMTVMPYESNAVLAAVMEATKGRGVAVAFDAVGGSTVNLSLDSLAERGLLVSYGASSGSPPRYSHRRLAERSLSIAAPHVLTYHRGAEMRHHARQLFDWVVRGIVRPHVGGRWPMQQAEHAHLALAARRTAGQLLLIP